MKQFRKLVCVLLAFSLLVCVCGVAAAAGGRKRYIVLGDSIGVGAGISNSAEGCYGRIIADTNGFSYANYAVNGNNSDDLRGRVTGDAAVIADLRTADIVSISIGGNDFLRSNMAGIIAKALTGDYSEADAVIAVLRRNMDIIIPAIRSYNPNVLILMQTLYNPQDNGTPVGAVYAETIRRLNTVFTDYAAAHPSDIEIVDVAAAFAGKSGLIAADTIHPNAAGNELIARCVQARLYELGVAASPDIVIRNEPLNHGSPKSVFARITELFYKIINWFKNLFS